MLLTVVFARNDDELKAFPFLPYCSWRLESAIIPSIASPSRLGNRKEISHLEAAATSQIFLPRSREKESTQAADPSTAAAAADYPWRL
jgi:hypothetical protein